MDEHHFDALVRTLGAAAFSRSRAVRLFPAGLGVLADLVRLDLEG
jgi:hypothetical protein